MKNKIEVTNSKSNTNSKLFNKAMLGACLVIAGVLAGCGNKDTNVVEITPAPIETPKPTPTIDPSLEEQELYKEIAKNLYKEIIANNNVDAHFDQSVEDTLTFVYIMRGHIPNGWSSEKDLNFVNSFFAGVYNTQNAVAFKFYNNKDIQLSKIKWIDIFKDLLDFEGEEIKGKESLEIISDLSFKVLSSENKKELKNNAQKLTLFCEEFFINEDNIITIDGVTYSLTGFAECDARIQLLCYLEAMAPIGIADSLDGNILGEKLTIRDIKLALYPGDNCSIDKQVDYDGNILKAMLKLIERLIAENTVVLENGSILVLTPTPTIFSSGN